MPDIIMFIDNASGTNERRSFEVGAAHDSLHEQRLEDEETEGEPGEIFDDEVLPHRQTDGCRDHCRGDDAGGVTRDAVNGRANALLPEWLDELLVGAGCRFLVRQHVEQEPDGTHVERDERPTPFHDCRLGVSAQLVERNVGGRQAG
jgi:hypothetical protein